MAPASLDCEAEMGSGTRLRLSCRPPTLWYHNMCLS
jgi:hypothetical protein